MKISTGTLWLIALFVVAVLVGTFALRPVKRVYGGLGGGPLYPDASAYTEEYQCLGIKQDYYPEGCSDCRTEFLCYGIIYGKTCYIQSVGKKEPTLCRNQ